MSADPSSVDRFVAMSVALTGFKQFHLRGSGHAELYLSTVGEIVGDDTMGEMLDAFDAAAADGGGDTDALESAIRTRIMSDEKLGPIARRLIKLWYVGTWYALPREWREAYGERASDRTFVPRASSYTEGLLWPAVGANPGGANPLGYGTWADPPRIEVGGGAAR